MQVGLDITSLLFDRGVSRYTANLARALADRKDIQLSTFGVSLRHADVFENFAQELRQQRPPHPIAHVSQKIPLSLHRFLWQFGLNRVQQKLPHLDLFHSWDWLQPPDCALPLVSTIHDLAILKFPETAHPKIFAMHQKSWKILKEREAEIIAVSYATKKDIVEKLEIPAHKVHVVYEALPLETVIVSEELQDEKYDELKQKLELNKPFLLFVGTREPRKNLLRLIEAWQKFAKDFQLIIAGEVGWDATDKYAKLLHNPQLRFLGKVTNQELTVLYQEADLFVYPSLYEGFGLPILEAFYHGTPVVTANTSSMPEVSGNAAELVDPLSVESIQHGMNTILTESLEAQQKRMQRMIIRLQMFNWQKVADETVKVYRKAMQE